MESSGLELEKKIEDNYRFWERWNDSAAHWEEFGHLFPPSQDCGGWTQDLKHASQDVFQSPTYPKVGWHQFLK
jgi:hypothetical protein